MKTSSRPGFTLVELLVVIAVILLLAGLVIAGASHMFGQQKARNTQALFQSLTTAVDQFRAANPLRSLYDVRGRETFGSAPPYQLDLDRPAGSQKSAPYALEGDPPAPDNDGISGPNLFSDRIARDLGCRPGGNVNDWWEVEATSGAPPRVDDEHMDNRALYAYLKAFTPGVLGSIQESNIRRIPHSLNATATFHMNPKGTSGNGHADHVDVLGFVDGWGVPIDYMVMAKYEWALVRDKTGVERAQYHVVDRQVVLRSRAMDAEKYKAWVASNPASPRQRTASLIDLNSSIYSSELPKPWANADPVTGRFLAGSGQEMRGNGWLRVVAKLDEYNYRPE